MDKIIEQNCRTQNIFFWLLLIYILQSLLEWTTDSSNTRRKHKNLIVLNEMLRSLPIPHEGEPSPGYNAKSKSNLQSKNRHHAKWSRQQDKQYCRSVKSQSPKTEGWAQRNKKNLRKTKTLKIKTYCLEQCDNFICIYAHWWDYLLAEHMRGTKRVWNRRKHGSGTTWQPEISKYKGNNKYSTGDTNTRRDTT